MKYLVVFSMCIVWSYICLAGRAEKFSEFEYYFYEEPGLMDKEAAPLLANAGIRSYGINVGGTSDVFYNLRAGSGWTDYSGSGSTTGDLTYRLQGESGLVSQFDAFKIFGGLGYRWLYDDWGGKTSSSGAYSYDRQSKYWYLPFGVIVKHGDISKWRFQYNYFLEGEQTSYLTDVPGYLNDIVNKQDSGSGFEIEYRFDKFRAIYIRSWDIDDSDLQAVRTVNGNGTGYEPKNETTELGVTIFFN